MTTSNTRHIVLLYFLFWSFAGLAQRVTDAAFQKELNGLLSHSVNEVGIADLDTTGMVILDARPSEEFVVSHIQGARRIGYRSKDLQVLKGLPKDQPIIVYCSVGYRSERVAEELKEAGYTNVSNLFGGIFEWKNQGHSVVNDRGSTEQVHTYNKKWSRWLLVGEKVW